MENFQQIQEKSVSHDDHLETFSLLWIRGAINKQDKSDNYEQRIRAIINHLKIFENIDQCEQYIQLISKEDRVIIIVNDQFSRELVPIIHDLYQVSSIYLYCSDEKKHKQWSKTFSKVICFLCYSFIITIFVLLDKSHYR